MTSPDDGISYSTICGTMLDDMIEQIVQNLITRSLLNEKLIRKEYGTVQNPKFHDPPPLTNNKKENEGKSRTKTINLDDSDSDNSDYDKEESDPVKKTRFDEPDIGRFSIHLNGKDVYANAIADNKLFLGDRASSIVVGTAQDTYFKCSNCNRKISGSRFGAHIDKCLGGRSRK